MPTPGHHALINNTCTCLPESKDVIEGKATCRRLPIANWLFYELLGVPNLGHQVLIINVPTCLPESKDVIEVKATCRRCQMVLL